MFFGEQEQYQSQRRKDMSNIPDQFLRWLRENLEENNLSQSEASRRAGLNQNAISEIINGKVMEVSLNVCKELASLFGTPVEEVLRLAGHLPPVDNPSLTRLVEVAKILAPEDIAELTDYARWKASKPRAEKSETPGPADTA